MLKRLGCAAVMLVACAAFAPTAIADDRFYNVVITGDGTPGAQDTQTIRITNESTHNTLGAVKLTAPERFTLSNPSMGTLEGTRTLVVDNLRIAKNGGSETITVDANNGCMSGDWDWTSVAKQANDFNGPPGNDFILNLANSDLTTSLSHAGCSNQQSNTANCTDGESDACQVTITTVHNSASGGIETLTVVANAPSARDSGTSSPSTRLNPTSPGLPSLADAGTLSARFVTDIPGDCSPYKSTSPLPAIVIPPPNRPTTVDFTLESSDPADHAAPRSCYAAPEQYPFVADPTSPVDAPSFTYEGATWNRGLLLACDPADLLALVNPCADVSGTAPTTTVTTRVPAGILDPAYSR